MAQTAAPNHPGGREPIDKVRRLQRTLYGAAKQQPGRRFHALYDRIHRSDVLWEAWRRVQSNRGAAGVDGVTLAAAEEYGIDRLLSELGEALRAGTYRPPPVLRRYIPKGDGRQRPLGIPTVKDRVAQAAATLVLEPIFEADFLPCSYKLLRSWLRAGVIDEGRYSETISGTPQGGVISPLLSNIYLHFLDTVWTRQCAHLGMLVRYADDFVVLARRREDVEEAERRVRIIFARLKLELHPDKTRRVELSRGKEGFDFLGCHLHKRLSGRMLEKTGRRIHFLHRWPSARSYAHRRLKRWMMRRRGRKLRAGQAAAWTPNFFWDHGLHRLLGTIRYPKQCKLPVKTPVKPYAGNPHVRFERRRVETGRV